MKLLYFGSGAFGLPTLAALHEGHEVVGVVTQPDRPAGRKRGMTATPVAEWAVGRGLAVLRSGDVNEPAFVARVRGLEPDASVVIAFGQKLSPELIGAMGGLAVNLHASLLPRYRGAAPIQRAVMEGEATTGVSVIALAERMDAGVVYAAAETVIDPHETAGELHDRLAGLGPAAVLGVLDGFASGALTPVEQDEASATRAAKLSKAEGTVDFDQPAERVRARVHGLTPWPGCRVRCTPAPGSSGGGDGGELLLRRVEVVEVAHGDEPGEPGEPGTVRGDLTVACGSGALRLLEVQAPGGKALPLEAFLRGHGLAAGDRLGAVGAAS